jgi:transposase InsO family protein
MQLGLDRKTLLGWQALVGKDVLPLGARPMRATPAQRQEVHEFIILCSFCLSLRDLEEHFPDIPRGELIHLHWAYVIANHRDHDTTLYWRTPGAVWAIDYSKADHPIDGIYPNLLVVRDLASGHQIAALPCYRQDSATALALIKSLFTQHQIPLVFKSDNGSHFVNGKIRSLLDRCHVVLLLSPPHYPRFNGACEAGIGGIKTRIHHLAARSGRPDRWTCDDVETARRQANASDWAGRGSTPEEIWDSVKPITDDQRLAFNRIVDRAIADRIHARGKLPLALRPKMHTVIRRGIADALVGTGHLTFWRRPVPQPLLGEKRE